MGFKTTSPPSLLEIQSTSDFQVYQKSSLQSWSFSFGTIRWILWECDRSEVCVLNYPDFWNTSIAILQLDGWTSQLYQQSHYQYVDNSKFNVLCSL